MWLWPPRLPLVHLLVQMLLDSKVFAAPARREPGTVPFYIQLTL